MILKLSAAMRAGTLILGAVLALASSAGRTSPAGATARAQIPVGATVLARALIADERSPAVLEVSAADVARGFVEVRGATRLTVANTSPYGYALDVWPAAPVFRSVIVGGLGADARLGDDGGAIVQRGQRGPALPLILDLRFQLAPGVAP
ncbi:MAG: hypothetical protein JSR54_07935, partial [Proteobacteria bacterium]|nr:hypothetical protein [Pseudomonadota bacterium]